MRFAVASFRFGALALVHFADCAAAHHRGRPVSPASSFASAGSGVSNFTSTGSAVPWQFLSWPTLAR